jgi:hypothetical protein
VNAIVSLVFAPQDEVTVGAVSKLSVVAHAILPGLTQRLMAKNAHRAQIENAPPEPDTDGNLIEPVAAGTGVNGVLSAVQKA